MFLLERGGLMGMRVKGGWCGRVGWSVISANGEPGLEFGVEN